MMAGKAQLFGDEEIRKEILACSDPRQIKALGRKVRGFDPEGMGQVQVRHCAER